MATVITLSKLVDLSQDELAKYLGVDLVDGFLFKPENSKPDWAKDTSTIVDAANSFVRFIQLAMFHAEGRISPSRKQDEVWHEFMLNPVAYYNFCIRECGKIIGHNGGFGLRDGEYEILLQEQQYTHSLWERVYGEPHPAVDASAERCHDTDCDFSCNDGIRTH